MPRPPPRFNPLECDRRRDDHRWLSDGMVLPRLSRIQFLRTINVRFLVPWYDAVPQIGAVLLAAGWWSAAPCAASPGGDSLPTPTALTWTGGLGLGLLVVLLIVLNRPRVDALTRASMPPLLPSERA